MVISNVSIYRAIAEDAYVRMVDGVENQRTPKQNGKGWIIKHDPGHVSFKNAMIVIVFTGMWLEALLHIRIVQKYDETKFRQYDFKNYKEKLLLLDVKDESLLEKSERFRKIRKELVHEKAFLDDGTIGVCQASCRLFPNEIPSSTAQIFSWPPTSNWGPILGHERICAMPYHTPTIMQRAYRPFFQSFAV